ncbi:MAG: hypothetical protein ACAH88_13550, partial [Roseimicrobium sp.]
YTAPPLLHQAAVPVMPYVRFLGINSGYRFFAPDPGPATVLWARIEHGDGSARWVEHPSRRRRVWTVAYQRELYPTMLLGAQVAPAGTVVAPGRPQISEVGVTYAFSYARHLAHIHAGLEGGSTSSPVRRMEMFVVTHAIRSPQQVRSGWRAEDLRLYYPVSLGEFSADGTPLAGAVRMGHERPSILQVAERMYRDGLASGAPLGDPDMPEALRLLLSEYPELRNAADRRPMQERIGAAVMSRDAPPKPGM